MASLFHMPRPRGKRNDDNLLGIGGDIGMTDSAFQGMGRAPVDELFAGRNSALINDAAWDEREAQARDYLSDTRQAILDQDGWIDRAEGSADDRVIREIIKDETGLDLYPGQGVNGQASNGIFMYEFDDSGAALADGWRDGETPTTLGGLLNHEELYQHYPELQDLPLNIEELGPRLMGSYGGIDQDHGLGRMRLNSSMNDKDIMDTILHETQHYIQRLENWPGGGGHNQRSQKNFANWHPGRTEQWEEVAKENQDDLENVRDQYGQEAYENISGEILARDVEKRFNGRNAIRNLSAQVNDPNSGFYGLPEERQDAALAAAENLADRLMYYPAYDRDAGNSYPHNMPEHNLMTNPYVMMNAMGSRIDAHGIKDDDTLNAYANADSLFEEAYREMQKREQLGKRR